MRRGLGPSSRQSEPLQLEGVATAGLVRDGVGPWNLAVLGVYFILREMKNSLSLASSITLNFALKIVSWLLPSSKTDCSALTTTRKWHCLCEANTIWLCPFHGAVRQLEFLKERFGDKDGNLPAGLPFFPTRGGAAAAKETVVETFKERHRRAEIAVVDSDNNELLGGHSMRTEGAVLLASEARWKSAMVIHYAKTAPLKKMSRDYAHGKVQQELHTRLDELAQALEDVERHGAGKPSQLERAEFIADRIEGPMKRMVQEEVATLKKQLLSAPSAFIQNPDRRKTWHRITYLTLLSQQF